MSSLNVLVIGGGAREHAISSSILKSALLNKLYTANCGAINCGEELVFENYQDLVNKSVEKEIDIVIIASEIPLCNGIVDEFAKQNIKCIGVDKCFSKLESSKIYAKDFMRKYKFKTPKYVIADENSKVGALPLDSSPLVIKPDGLCYSKGVSIVYDRNSAMTTIVRNLTGKFGESSKKMLLEDYLDGDEITLISLWDGNILLNFLPIKNFNRLLPDKMSPILSGMGTYCPVELTELQKQKLSEYQDKLSNALKSEGANFTGFISSNLVWSKQDDILDWSVLDLDVHLGETEIETLLVSLETDFLEILYNASISNLDSWKNENTVKYKDGVSASLSVFTMNADKNSGALISLLRVNDISIYLDKVEYENGHLFANGERNLILSCTTMFNRPFKRLIDYADTISMNNKYYRKDLERLNK